MTFEDNKLPKKVIKKNLKVVPVYQNLVLTLKLK